MSLFDGALMSPISESLLLLGLALVVTVVGFYRVVYFVSLGYAGSIALFALLSLWRFGAQLPLGMTLQCALLGLYGLRLGSFLFLREREPSYRKELADVQSRAVGLGLLYKFAIWIGVSVLYVLMFVPATFNIALHRSSPSASASMVLVWLGVTVMTFGLLLESVADRQKAAFKRTSPNRFCDVKLYRLVRCPNYLGETIFWIGNFVCGAAAYLSYLHWLSSGVGLLCITLVMVGSTKRLEKKQAERYGGDPEYQRYVQSVPVLFPFVPLYSLQNWRIALG
jgi:steroid 5-alpha reductase family enzyme